MKRDIVSAEAGKDTFYGDMQIDESSSDEEIAQFLNKYQNAVIAGLDSQVKSIYHKAERNVAQQAQLEKAIADWDGKEGGEEIIEGLRKKFNMLTEQHIELVGGTPDNSSGKVGELEKQLDEAIHIKEAMQTNSKLFVDRNRAKVASLKAMRSVDGLVSLEA